MFPIRLGCATNQTLIIMKEKKYHGEYYSPGQGKRPEQYEHSAKIATYAIAVIIVLFVAVVIFTAIGVITNL